MEFVLALAAIALTIIFVAYLRRSQPKISCPQCTGTQIRTVEQQLKQLKQDSRIEGFGVIDSLGTKMDVQLIMETQYRCQACEHSWSVTAPEK